MLLLFESLSFFSSDFVEEISEIIFLYSEKSRVKISLLQQARLAKTEKLESLGVSMAVSPLHDMDEKKDKDTWNSSDVIRNA